MRPCEKTLAQRVRSPFGSGSIPCNPPWLTCFVAAARFSDDHFLQLLTSFDPIYDSH